jgi:hypothetical protein
VDQNLAAQVGAKSTEKIFALFAWLISHQSTVLFSQNKPATSNQPAVLLSQNKPAPAISHQPNEQAACLVSTHACSAADRFLCIQFFVFLR